RAGVKMSREELLESDDGSTDVRRAKALFRGFYEALSDEIELVRALGGEVKDIEQGLVAFPARRRGEDILLCWRLGEKTIGFWHGLESGDAGRPPIDDDAARGPPPLARGRPARRRPPAPAAWGPGGARGGGAGTEGCPRGFPEGVGPGPGHESRRRRDA